MPSFDAKALAAWTGGRWSSFPDAAPRGFSVDSRRLAPGQAFVALRTGKRDGHDFLGEARRAGAPAAVVSREVPGAGLPQLVVGDPLAALQAVAREHRRAFPGTVVGITGSAGKTSTKDLLSVLLGGEEGGVLSTEGNLNNHIGVPLTLCRLEPARHRYAVVEAGISAPGEMGVLAGMIEPDIVLVTLVAPAHLDHLGGLEGVAREKAMLAGAMRAGGTCIFPSSCAGFAAFRALPAAACVQVEPVAELPAGAAPGRVPFTVSHSGLETSITLGLENGPQAFTLRRVTGGMAQNAAIALCAAQRLGVGVPELRERLPSWLPVALRGEWRNSHGRRLYLDCYNANPASMADALEAFRAVAPRGEPRLFVIGCMEELGEDAPRYHLELGRSLGLGPGDQLVAVGALAGAVRDGALESGAGAGQILVADKVGPLADRLAAFRGSVFVKGSRRHELERAFAGPEYAESAHA